MDVGRRMTISYLLNEIGAQAAVSLAGGQPEGELDHALGHLPLRGQPSGSEHAQYGGVGHQGLCREDRKLLAASM